MPAAAAARQHHIPELLALHADELAFLWGQRRAAMHDARHTLRSFAELNDRVEAHAQGLLTVPSALPGLLGKRLMAATDRDEAFAAAHGLLRLADPAVTARLSELFAMLPGPQLVGLRDALASTSLGIAAPAIQALLVTSEPERAVAAATVLALHGLLHPDEPRLAALMADADAAVAAQAWRVSSLVDARQRARHEAPPPRPYKPALTRPEPALREAALAAAVWSAQPWLLSVLRRLAADGDSVALGWLAAVGGPEDGPQLRDAAGALEQPADRAGLLARWGHVDALRLLLEMMAPGSDAATASAAGGAFERVTGLEVRAARVLLPVAADADEFEREFTPSVWLPDAAKARTLFERHEADWAAAARWNRGVALGGQAVDPVAWNRKVDLPARWDACARAALAGRPIAAPPPAL